MKKNQIGFKKMMAFFMVFLMMVQCLPVLQAHAEEGVGVEGVTVNADATSPTGYTATFVYKNDTADKVEIDSKVLWFHKDDQENWQDPRYTPHEWQKGMFAADSGAYQEELENIGNGYWKLTLPLPSGAFSYRYRVTTGTSSFYILDPANLPSIGTGATGQQPNYSMVYMPFDPEKQDPAEERSLEMPVVSTQMGRVEHTTYVNALGKTRPLAVYLPKGYDANRAEPYKVLYLSHGQGGQEMDWMIDGSVPNILDNMIADGKIEPFIAVSMSWQGEGGAGFDTANGNPVNVAEIMDNIIPAMDSKYNVSKDPSGRSMAGMSAGAGLSSHVWMKYPDQFGYFGFLSCGSFQDLQPAAGMGLEQPRLMVAIGKQDTTKRYEGNQGIMQKLDELGIDYVYHEENGAHDWRMWSRLLSYYLENVLWKTEESVGDEGVTVNADATSPTGYTATFVYKDAAATNVYLQGDAMYFADDKFKETGKLYTPYEWKKGMFPISGLSASAATEEYPYTVPATPKYNVAMQKVGSDTWTVTVPLPSGAYKYSYYKDSDGKPGNGTKVLDPANLPLQNTDTEIFANFSIVYMPFDAEKQEDDRSITLPYSGENGRIVFETFNENVTGTKKTVPIAIYLPYGYDENRTEPYKVLYLSHGGGGHERDWTNDGTMPNIMDHMIGDGRLEATIVVAVNFSVLGNDHTIMAGVQKEHVIPLLESKYNASTQVKDRAYAGLSRGGEIAGLMMVDASNKPNDYVQYGTWGIWSPRDVPTDELEALRNDANFMAELKKLNIVVDSGFEDEKHFRNSESLIKKLNDMGVSVYQQPTYVSGGHDWMLWPKLLESFAENTLWKDNHTEITLPAKVSTTTDIHVNSGSSYSVALSITNGAWNVVDGTDVTDWFTNENGDAAFTNTTGVAIASISGTTLEIALDASKISGFSTNGSGELYVTAPNSAINGDTYSEIPVKVGSYTIPTLIIDNHILGSLFSGNSGAAWNFERIIHYNSDSKAMLSLELDNLDNSLIDSSKATVILDNGDGYYPDEFIFKATGLVNEWSNGKTSYALKEGDLEYNSNPDTGNNERAWTTLGGDGQGNYYFNLTVSGITYNGLPVEDQTFRIRIYNYGRDFVKDAANLYANKPIIEAKIAPLANPVTPTTEPIWTWLGSGDMPILSDYLADDFYVSWPKWIDASTLTASDITLTMLSKSGDKKILTPGIDYVIGSSKGETQIAVIYQNLSFVPVYNELEIKINENALQNSGTSLNNGVTTKVFDIASVYVYYTQFGGSGEVRAWSFYGFENLTSVWQLLKETTYTLSVKVGNETKYYAEDNNGKAIFVNTAKEAKVFDGSGPEDRNVQLLGNHISLLQVNEPNFPKYSDKQVDSQTYTFTKNYSGGTLYNPSQLSTEDLVAAPGYAIPWGTTNWITMEKWAWQESVDIGWKTIDIQTKSIAIEYLNKTPIISLARNTTEQFIANTDKTVVWGVVGNKSPETTISEDGLLTIAANEPSNNLTVYASVPDVQFMEGAVAVDITASLETMPVPIANPGSGTYSNSKNVTLSSSITGAKIYYTTDGSTPTQDSTLYNSPITVSKSTILKAYAVKDGYNSSEVVTYTYTITYTTSPTEPASPTSPTEPTSPTIPTEPTEPNFKDVGPGFSWAKDAINSLAQRGIILGDGNSNFMPRNGVIRADFVLMISRIIPLDMPANVTQFNDVPVGAYYQDAVMKATGSGLINGIGNGNFAPKGSITRQDAFVIIYRLLNHLGKTDGTKSDMSNFKDSSKVASYAQPALEFLVGKGIVKGDNILLRPNGEITRAEVAVVLDRIIKMYGL